MSGLRETIRRRGGLELTSRVVGGLWVVGQRTVPEKPSPYSAAATAALKAAFPTQWPTIRDYGFAHPEIVGYMNAYAPEDAKIAYSLVEGIGWRWICGKGQLDTGVIPTANTTFIDKFKPLTGINEWIVTSNYTTWANNTTGYIQNSSAVQWFIGGTGTTPGNGYYRTTQMIIDRKVVVEKTKTKYIYDGTDIPTGNGGNYNTSQLYARTADNLYRERLQIAENGVDVRDYVPFKLGVARTASQVSTGVAQSAGTLGMLDMVTGIFYPNTASGGSYSELIESPS